MIKRKKNVDKESVFNKVCKENGIELTDKGTNLNPVSYIDQSGKVKVICENAPFGKPYFGYPDYIELLKNVSADLRRGKGLKSEKGVKTSDSIRVEPLITDIKKIEFNVLEAGRQSLSEEIVSAKRNFKHKY